MQNIYSVYDSKAEAFLQPFFATADGVAIRMFQQAANDSEHDFSKWAEDYTLFNLGKWDPKNGTLFSAEVNNSLGTAMLFKTAIAASSNGIETNPPTSWAAPLRTETSE